MPDLEITTRDIEQDGEVYATVISASGYIDPSTIDPFEKALDEEPSQAGYISAIKG